MSHKSLGKSEEENAQGYNETLLSVWEKRAKSYNLKIPKVMLVWSDQYLPVLSDSSTVYTFLSFQGNLLMAVKSKCPVIKRNGVEIYQIKDPEAVQIVSCKKATAELHKFGKAHLGKAFWKDKFITEVDPDLDEEKEDSDDDQEEEDEEPSPIPDPVPVKKVTAPKKKASAKSVPKVEPPKEVPLRVSAAAPIKRVVRPPITKK